MWGLIADVLVFFEMVLVLSFIWICVGFHGLRISSDFSADFHLICIWDLDLGFSYLSFLVLFSCFSFVIDGFYLKFYIVPEFLISRGMLMLDFLFGMLCFICYFLSVWFLFVVLIVGFLIWVFCWFFYAVFFVDSKIF